MKKHLTLEERNTILIGIKQGCDKATIAKMIGKNKSTVSLEIKKHRTCAHKSNLVLECDNYKHCKYNRKCTKNCPDFKEFYCKRRDRSPGACNGCSNYKYCRFSKYSYNPITADKEYKSLLSSSREGINQTKEEIAIIGEVVSALLLNGQSPYMVIANHPELNITERTLYTYIDLGFFKKRGVDNITLRRKVSRKPTKKLQNLYKKRQDRSYLNGRLYKDYLEFKETNDMTNCIVIQMDTVYNDVSKGPFVQTFKFVDFGFLFILFQKTKTSEDMLKGIDILDELLSPLRGDCSFVILTDRGSEFIKADEGENRKDGSKRFNIFYCDPMCSHQKGSLENNHEELRYILPKNTDLYFLGFDSQEKANLITSNINSAKKEHLKGKSPFDLLDFYYPELVTSLNKFGVKRIKCDDVILTPNLIK